MPDCSRRRVILYPMAATVILIKGLIMLKNNKGDTQVWVHSR